MQKRTKLNVFESLDCRELSCELALSADSFDLNEFREALEVNSRERASFTGTCAPKYPSSGYHVHFRGVVKPKDLNLTADYVKGVPLLERDEGEPFAEDFMVWLGRFVKGNQSSHVTILCKFRKRNDRWRSRFNLPFKVTLSPTDTEVLIDGISLGLPANEYGAKHGWLTRFDAQIDVAVSIEKRINLRKFKLEAEIAAANDSIRMFVEEVAK